MDSKEMKKKRDSSRIQIGLTLSAKQNAVLSKMMEDDEWTNRNGFIKYKIFGDSEEYQYKKLLESGEKQDILNVVSSLLSDLNRQIDYINFRFDNELLDFKRQMKEIDEAKARKWVTYLEEWKSQIQKKTDEIFFDCQMILRAINIRVERKDYKDVRSLPDYILDKAAEDWNDTDSPLIKERARRIMEKFYMDHPDAVRPEYKTGNKEE